MSEFTQAERGSLDSMVRLWEGGDSQIMYEDSKKNPTFGVGIKLDSVAKKALNRDQRLGVAIIPQDIRDNFYNIRRDRAIKAAVKFAGGTKEFAKMGFPRRSMLTQMAFNLGDAGLNDPIDGFKEFKKKLRSALQESKALNREAGLKLAAGEIESSLWFNQVKTRGQETYKTFVNGDQIYLSQDTRNDPLTPGTLKTLTESMDQKRVARDLASFKKNRATRTPEVRATGMTTQDLLNLFNK